MTVREDFDGRQQNSVSRLYRSKTRTSAYSGQEKIWICRAFHEQKVCGLSHDAEFVMDCSGAGVWAIWEL